MNIRSIFTVLCLAASLSLSAQTTHTSVIEPLKNEKWWGGYVSLGTQMPFTDCAGGNLATDNKANQAVPFLISNTGRYVWSDHPFSFSIKEGKIQIQSDYEKVMPVTEGKTLRETYLIACQRHFKPSGILPDKLLFSMPQYNTWIELMYNQNQEDIMQYANNIIDNGFPKGVIMIDDNWQKYYGNFDFKPDKFPDPKQMIRELHDKGFKVMVWVCPFVSADSPEFRALNAKGYLIKDAKGEAPAMISWWNGYSACYDLTNPAAYQHLLEQLKTIQQTYGIDGFKFDAGDTYFYTNGITSFKKDAVAVDHLEAWNKMGLEFAFNEYRASWKMGGTSLVQRLCDKAYSWGALESLVPDMLAASMLGYAYTCPDLIGGGEFSSFLNAKDKPIDQMLIVRSAQTHAMMPMMQFSVAPWRILDAEHLEYCRQAALLHEKMGPYILELAQEASQTGAPILRQMEYEFPKKGFADCNDQFMLGTRYLVAPITTATNKRSVRLPNGKWKDTKGKIYKGPLVISITAEKGELPYFEYLSKSKH